MENSADMTAVELTAEELNGVVGGYEKQPGGDSYPYDREGKCSKCKVLSWWNSKKNNLKACPRCGGSWEYVHTGKY